VATWRALRATDIRRYRLGNLPAEDRIPFQSDMVGRFGSLPVWRGVAAHLFRTRQPGLEGGSSKRVAKRNGGVPEGWKMQLSFHRRLSRGFAAAIVALFLLCVPASAQHATGQLSMHYMNVGQADAIYIECPEPEHHNMLIDSGDATVMRVPVGFPGTSKQILAS
jgi:hypothetical protein